MGTVRFAGIPVGFFANSRALIGGALCRLGRKTVSWHRNPGGRGRGGDSNIIVTGCSLYLLALKCNLVPRRVLSFKRTTVGIYYSAFQNLQTLKVCNRTGRLIADTNCMHVRLYFVLMVPLIGVKRIWSRALRGFFQNILRVPPTLL